MSGRDEVAARAYAGQARSGNAAAMFNYGLMLLHGRGVPADAALGRAWIERSFGMGVVSAAVALGDLARPGGAGPDDFARAAAYFRFAAHSGDARGMHALGNLHVAGAGVPRSAEDAYFWYLLAAQRGHSGSAAARDRLRQVLPPQLRMATEARAAGWTPDGG